MTTNKDAHKATTPSDDPSAIRADIERTREDLGDSAAALAAKADVKARAAAKSAELKDRTTAKSTELKDRAAAKSAEAKDRAAEKTKEVKDRAAEKATEVKDRAKDTAERAAETARQRPTPVVGVLAAAATAIGAGVLIRRRRAAKLRAKAPKRWLRRR